MGNTPVTSLHTAIKELQDEVEDTDSILNRTGASKKGELDVLVRKCNTVLQLLHKLVAKYKSLVTNHKPVWDRVSFGSENLQEHARGSYDTHVLTLFLATLETSS